MFPPLFYAAAHWLSIDTCRLRCAMRGIREVHQYISFSQAKQRVAVDPRRGRPEQWSLSHRHHPPPAEEEVEAGTDFWSWTSLRTVRHRNAGNVDRRYTDSSVDPGIDTLSISSSILPFFCLFPSPFASTACRDTLRRDLDNKRTALDCPQGPQVTLSPETGSLLSC